MKLDVFVDSRAETEAREALRWYAERNARAAAEFQRAITLALDALGESPHVWQEIEPGVRRCLLSGFPYGVVYRVQPERVEVLAIMHLKRRPGYWHSRRE